MRRGTACPCVEQDQQVHHENGRPVKLIVRAGVLSVLSHDNEGRGHGGEQQCHHAQGRKVSRGEQDAADQIERPKRNRRPDDKNGN
jgi:hypothetical protein